MLLHLFLLSSFLTFLLAMPKFLSISEGDQNGIIAYHDTWDDKAALEIPTTTASTTITTNDTDSDDQNCASLSPILFLPGYRSVMTGKKAVALEDYCRRTNRRFVRFDYRGHGASSGDFLDWTLTDWINDTLLVLDTLNLCDSQQHPPILVGSSMGAWIAFCVAQQRPVAGIVGLAPAVDFVHDLYGSLTPDEHSSLENDGLLWRSSAYNSDDEPYPFTKRFLDDARQWSLLESNDKNRMGMRFGGVGIPIRLIHGMKDKDIPWARSLEISSKICHDNVVVSLTKNGDHRLSTPDDLRLMLDAIESICR